MTKFPFELLKLAAASSGPLLIWRGISLFETYVASGKEKPDELHQVLVNNHGVYRYITESQSNEYMAFLGTGTALLIAMFIAIAIRLNRAET